MTSKTRTLWRIALISAIFAGDLFCFKDVMDCFKSPMQLETRQPIHLQAMRVVFAKPDNLTVECENHPYRKS